MGTILLYKFGAVVQRSEGAISHYSLKRIEHLRRAVAQRLAILARLAIAADPNLLATMIKKVKKI